jgi:hypothetical protein
MTVKSQVPEADASLLRMLKTAVGHDPETAPSVSYPHLYFSKAYLNFMPDFFLGITH